MNAPASWRTSDPEDPFGSCPDEKPPEGWSDGFWDGVRDRIERGRETPDAGRMPEPRHGRARVALVVVLLAATSGLLAVLRGPGGVRPPRAGGDRVLVRVTAQGEPPVSVDWARRGGTDAPFVVLESIGPEISYLMLEPDHARGRVVRNNGVAP